MGFDVQILRFILSAKQAGADFADAATLGRQNLHVDARTLETEARRAGFGFLTEKTVFASYPYVDSLMTELGAEQLHSIDASDYEGATHIADLNRPVGDELKERFSLLIDGGTLEHIFDFPQAVRNVAAMLKVGGHFLSINGANNFTGHGFYQFSPELYFRVFSPQNGFEIETIVMTEVNADGDWFEVTDPVKARARVGLINNCRTYLMMRARKIASVEMFETIPQQSDYHDINWKQPEKMGDMSYLERPLTQRVVERWFPRPARGAMRRLRQCTRRHFASPHLTRVRSFD